MHACLCALLGTPACTCLGWRLHCLCVCMHVGGMFVMAIVWAHAHMCTYACIYTHRTKMYALKAIKRIYVWRYVGKFTLRFGKIHKHTVVLLAYIKKHGRTHWICLCTQVKNNCMLMYLSSMKDMCAEYMYVCMYVCMRIHEKQIHTCKPCTGGFKYTQEDVLHRLHWSIHGIRAQELLEVISII